MARKPQVAEEFEGYRVGDITYCIDPETQEFFPVRVTQIERRFLEVEALDRELSDLVSPEFKAERANRVFVRPRLPSTARFGGCDERIVNTHRESGQELRLLPYHYGTTTGVEIKNRHQKDSARWPLPTGTVFERWFKDQ